ncbi:hypothetical protein Micbo1qcDRAFT_47055 [Microdochium bolleyi]|uniref:Uncharacterized protein n=1 Tax=Microdochium bolleyi TaxID=196109 RepID=A0A136JCN6_9PEZI|nr:hypothetical protein Micbo1qcDRAFT_47055 [Microdochium bolleyi]
MASVRGRRYGAIQGCRCPVLCGMYCAVLCRRWDVASCCAGAGCVCVVWGTDSREGGPGEEESLLAALRPQAANHRSSSSGELAHLAPPRLASTPPVPLCHPGSHPRTSIHIHPVHPSIHPVLPPGRRPLARCRCRCRRRHCYCW